VSQDSIRPDPGTPPTPPLRLQRLLTRLALLVAIVWGSPFTIYLIAELWYRRYGAWALACFIGFAVLCHVAGRLVGRFERDSPRQYAVGCSWPYWLFGAIGVATGWEPGIACLLGAVVLSIAGWMGAKKAVGRWTKLLAEGKCLFCEYDLAGLGPSGPECGQKFDRAARASAA